MESETGVQNENSKPAKSQLQYHKQGLITPLTFQKPETGKISNNEREKKLKSKPMQRFGI